MTEWHFWGEKQFADVYENIYLRTFTEDWFNIVNTIAKELSGFKKIIDIGCGEGHTSKQILDRISGEYECDLLEPNKAALVNGKEFLFPENNIKDCYVTTLGVFQPVKKYDSAYTIHTNYYWAFTEKGFDEQLEKLMSLINDKGRALILTLPEDSDHYKIMLRQIYPEFNYSKHMIDYYKEKGYKVRVKRFKMRMYVGDILSTKSYFDLKSFFKFIHNQNVFPSDVEAKEFLAKIKRYEKKGYLDFRDELLIVEKL